MLSKSCIDCGGKFPLTSFYKHRAMADGHLNKCIECVKVAARKNRLEKVEYYRSYDRSRSNQQHRIEARTEYALKQDKKEYFVRAKLKWSQNNADKRKAQHQLNNAIRDERVTKLPCVVCGSWKSHGHHVAYDLPFDVSWLCPKHHSQTHVEHRMIERGEFTPKQIAPIADTADKVSGKRASYPATRGGSE